MAGLTRAELPDGTIWESEYEPSIDQVKFHQARERFTLFGGSRGGGKTAAFIEDSLAFAIQNPGSPQGYARKDLKDLKDTIYPEFLKRVPEVLYAEKYGGQFHRSENWVRFFNGSVIRFFEMKDVHSQRSATIARWNLEEVHEIPNIENVVRELNGTLRWTTGKGKCERPECYADAAHSKLKYEDHALHPLRQIKMATNPTAGWLKDKFYTPYKKGTLAYSYRYIPASVFNNPGADVAYRAALLDNPPRWVDNFVMGNWEAFENMAFPEFNQDLHVLRGPIPYQQFRRVHAGVDYGSFGRANAHRSAISLHAELRDGRVLTFEEFSEAGAPSRTLFDWLAERTKRYNIETIWADASQNIANQEFANAGLPVRDAPRYQGAVKDGVNLWNRLMKADATGRPQWQIHENCPNLIHGIEAYSVDENGNFVKIEDDDVDGGRYGLMGLNVQPFVMVSAAVPMRSPYAAEKRRVSAIIEAKRAARHDRLAAAIKESDS